MKSSAYTNTMSYRMIKYGPLEDLPHIWFLMVVYMNCLCVDSVFCFSITRDNNNFHRNVVYKHSMSNVCIYIICVLYMVGWNRIKLMISGQWWHPRNYSKTTWFLDSFLEIYIVIKRGSCWILFVIRIWKQFLIPRKAKNLLLIDFALEFR